MVQGNSAFAAQFYLANAGEIKGEESKEKRRKKRASFSYFWTVHFVAIRGGHKK